MMPKSLSYVATALLIAIALLNPAAVMAQSGKLLTIAVFDFEVPGLNQTVKVKNSNKSYYVKDLVRTDQLTTKFVTALTKSGRLQVVERSRMDEIMTEMDLSTSGLTDPARSVEVGKLLGADLLLMGSLDYITAEVETRPIAYTSRVRSTGLIDIGASIRLVDAEKGTIVAADSHKVTYLIRNLESSAQLEGRYFHEAQEELVDQLTKAVLDEAFPVKVALFKDGSVYINRGSKTGVEAGNTFRVVRPGEKLIDPDTGIVLGSSQTEVAVITVKSAELNMSICTVGQWLGASQEIMVGDICKPLRVADTVPAAATAPGPSVGDVF